MTDKEQQRERWEKEVAEWQEKWEQEQLNKQTTYFYKVRIGSNPILRTGIVSVRMCYREDGEIYAYYGSSMFTEILKAIAWREAVDFDKVRILHLCKIETLTD